MPARIFPAVAAIVTAHLLVVTAAAQALPDPSYPDLRPELSDYRCEERGDDSERPEPTTEAQRARFAMRARYREYFPAFLARVGPEPASELVMPVDGVTLSQIADTYGAPRWDRSHEGVDIFAPRGTAVRAAAPGFVYRIDDLSLGGLSVTVFGDGGVRYFYTHFDSVPEELVEGQRVEVVEEVEPRPGAQHVEPRNAVVGELRQRLTAEARSAGAEDDDVGRIR